MKLAYNHIGAPGAAHGPRVLHARVLEARVLEANGPLGPSAQRAPLGSPPGIPRDPPGIPRDPTGIPRDPLKLLFFQNRFYKKISVMLHQ